MKDPVIPPDQFTRVQNEFSKLVKMLEEVEDGLALARGIHKLEAQRSLSEASKHLEISQFYMEKAIKEARAEK